VVRKSIALALILACAPVLGCARPEQYYHEPAPRITPAIINAIIAVESGGNPYAVGRNGTIGLCQIKPSTGRMLGYSEADLFDPVKNVEAAEKYLTMMLDQFGGNLTLALQAYNCGPSGYNQPHCRDYAQRVLGRL